MSQQGRHRTRGHRGARRLLAALLAVLAGVLGAFVLYETSLQPGAALAGPATQTRARSRDT
jgi:hypothetical protein